MMSLSKRNGKLSMCHGCPMPILMTVAGNTALFTKDMLKKKYNSYEGEIRQAIENFSKSGNHDGLNNVLAFTGGRGGGGMGILCLACGWSGGLA